MGLFSAASAATPPPPPPAVNPQQAPSGATLSALTRPKAQAQAAGPIRVASATTSDVGPSGSTVPDYKSMNSQQLLDQFRKETGNPARTRTPPAAYFDWLQQKGALGGPK